MLKVNDSIKNAYNQFSTQRKSYIKVGDNSFFIQNLEISADAYNEGNVVGNAISKMATFDIETEHVKGLHDFEIFDGIWTGNGYEYISLGTFKLFEEKGTDEFFSNILAYDKLILFNKPYDPNLTTYPTTLYGLLQNVCEQAEVELETLSIANGDKILEENLFVEGETLKQILKAICGISGNFAVISSDKLKLTLKNDDNLVLDKYQLSNPEYKRTTWKINQVVLGMTNIDGEHVLRQDDEDIEENGVHKLVINDNPFVYTQNLREQYIDDLFEKVKGFGYIAFDTFWEGLPFVELGDTLTIDGKESVVLRYTLKSPDGLNSTLEAPSIIDSTIEYLDNIDNAEKRRKITEYKVDKAEGNITLLTQTTSDIWDSLNNNYYEKTTIDKLVQNSESGVTNTFSEIGGNNIFRNTGLWFKGEGTIDTTITGESINSIASNATEIKNVKVNGSTKQNIYTGQQLLDISYHSNYWSNYFTVSGDYIIIDNITDIETNWIYIYLGNTGLIEENKEYALFLETEEASGRVDVEIGGSNTAELKGANGRIHWHNVSVGTRKGICTKYNGEMANFEYQLNISFKIYSHSRAKIRLSVIEDTTVTEDNFVYEPFVGAQPSPSVQYPQSISVAQGNIVISSESATQLSQLTYNLGTNFLSENDYIENGILYKNTGKIDSYNGEQISGNYVSTTGGLDTGATIYYELDTPQEIELTQSGNLYVYSDETSITNNADVEMELTYELTSEYEYWDGVVVKGTNDNATNNRSMLLQNGKLSQEQEVGNGNYSISFYYRKLKMFANASVIINDVEYPLDSMEEKLFYTGEQDTETGEYITQPIIVTSKRIKIEFISDMTNSVEIYDLMCNKGNVKLAYSQNENETTTDTVNISKGITITSTNIDVIFKANADGIRLYTLNGQVKTRFTDKGMTTKEAIIEDEAQVVGTLWQEIGDQTWITRM
jgi:hypothetical protein